MTLIKTKYLNKIEEIFSGKPYEITYNADECLNLFAHLLEVNQLEKEDIPDNIIALLLKLPRESFIGWVCYLSTKKINLSENVTRQIFSNTDLLNRAEAIKNSVNQQEVFEWANLYVDNYKNEFTKGMKELNEV